MDEPFFARNVEISGVEVKAEALNGVFQLNLSIPRADVIAVEILLNVSRKITLLPSMVLSRRRDGERRV